MTLKSIYFLAALLIAGFGAHTATAQNSIGGHFGIVQPLVTFQDGETISGFDPYAIGFPMGITVRKTEKFAFDLEFVPFISSNEDATGDTVTAVNELLIHPGLLWGIGDKLTFGNRLAYETQSGRFGITPLLNKGFLLGKTNAFIELVLPVRAGNDTDLSITAALHLGVGF